MVGKFATSKAGHDKGQLYVVVAQEREYVYLCDGRLKTVQNPKKKKRKHIQLINRTIEEELLQKLKKKEKLHDEQIKYAIKQYNNL